MFCGDGLRYDPSEGHRSAGQHEGLDVVGLGCPHFGATLWHAGGKDLEPHFGISLLCLLYFQSWRGDCICDLHHVAVERPFCCDAGVDHQNGCHLHVNLERDLPTPTFGTLGTEGCGSSHGLLVVSVEGHSAKWHDHLNTLRFGT